MKLNSNLVPADTQDNSRFQVHRMESNFYQYMLYGVLKIWFATLRHVILDAEGLQTLLNSGKRFVFVCWHSDVLYLGFQVPRPAVLIISPSRDGGLIAGLLGRLGYEVVRGSRQKGGLLAIKQMAQLMETKGLNAGIVADGSKGPARRVQNGPVVLARDTGAWILPVAMAARPVWRAHSWDRTKVPLPFAKVVMAYEEPFLVPAFERAEGLMVWRRHLEDALNRAEQRAEEVLR
jgi:lysophospholipid acyltransferase (LPLAT)-like uncharacterized protein